MPILWLCNRTIPKVAAFKLTHAAKNRCGHRAALVNEHGPEMEEGVPIIDITLTQPHTFLV
jgi:hypothetical protein